MYIPEQGDLVYFDFDPSSGKAIMKRRPAFIISKHIFNEHTGFALLAPINSSIRNMRLEVVLPKGMPTTGSILIHQIKSLDFLVRGAELIEKTPTAVTQEVLMLARAVIS